MKLRPRAYVAIVIVAGVLVTGTAAIISEVIRLREGAQRSDCRMRLTHISLALLQYQDEYGSLPPAITTNANGKPMHSWRVLILPVFFGGEETYSMYDFAEPWDGPRNSRLHTGSSDLGRDRYYCLSAGGQITRTNYVAVTGPGTVWSKGVIPVDASNQASPEVLIIEMPGMEIDWMEPRDITIDDAVARLAAGFSDAELIHPQGIQYIATDQRVYLLPRNGSEDDFRRILTPKVRD